MEPEAFIATCRRLTAGDLGPGVATSAHVAVAETMPSRYAIPFPVTVERTFHRRMTPSRTRRGQWHEMVQHLTDLNYLTLESFQAWHRFRVQDQEPSNDLLLLLAEAVRLFLAEDDYAGFRLLPPFPAGSLVTRLDWVESYLSPLVYRLAHYTSFDGDTHVRPRYRIGEQSAYGRSLAFRMRVYFHHYRQRYTARSRVYFERDQLPLLYQLDSALGGAYRHRLPDRDAQYLHVAIQELLTDGTLVFDAFRRANRFMPQASGNYYLQYSVADATVDASGKREEKLARRADRQIDKHELHEDTGSNRLGVRLLQLTLWRAGFYTGILDGAFGPLSHRAVLALIAQEREYGKWKDRKLDRVVVRAAEAGSWLVDLKLIGRLLDTYAPPPEEQAKREELEIWEGLRESGAADQLDREFADRQREVNFAYGNPEHHPQRRVYFGLRSLLRGAFRAIKRIISWVRGVVEQILGAVFDFVKALAKRLQEGIGLFFSGFRCFGHLLLGRPFITVGAGREGASPVLFTRYRIDFDVVNLLDPRVSEAEMQNHRRYIRETVEGAAFFVRTVTTLIRFIAGLQPPLSWVYLGVRIARVVRAQLSGNDEVEQVV